MKVTGPKKAHFNNLSRLGRTWSGQNRQNCLLKKKIRILKDLSHHRELYL